MIVLPVFCPKCGIHMKDHDTDEDVTKRWLRCGLCGYCEPKMKKPQEVNPEADTKE